MDEKRLKKLIPLLALMLAFIILNKSGVLAGKSKLNSLLPEQFPDVPNEGLIQKAQQDQVKKQEELRINKTELEKSAWVKNIFLPLVKSGSSAGQSQRSVSDDSLESLNFTGWASKAGEAIAIVSDKLVRIGDKIDDKSVVIIESDRVVLQDSQGKNYVITYNARADSAEPQ